MTVTFQPRGTDTLHFLRHVVTKTVLGACVALFVLSIPPILVFAVASPAASDPHDKPLTLAASLAVLIFPYSLLSLALLLGAAVTPWIAPPVTVTLSPELCRLEAIYTQDIPWRSFSSITEEAGHFYFAYWKRTVFVPVSAFPDRAAADAFFQTALTYWREAKAGTLP